VYANTVLRFSQFSKVPQNKAFSCYCVQWLAKGGQAAKIVVLQRENAEKLVRQSGPPKAKVTSSSLVGDTLTVVH
jgi:hypothetical protein